MKKKLIVGALVMLLAYVGAGAAHVVASDTALPNYHQAADEPALAAVLEAYQAALLARDRDAFKALFYSDLSPVYGVYRQKGRDIEIALENADYIDQIIRGGMTPEQKFWNVMYKSDGLTATITSDFRFYIDGRQTNWGAESWHLAKTEKGWKILSIMFSVQLGAEPQ